MTRSLLFIMLSAALMAFTAGCSGGNFDGLHSPAAIAGQDGSGGASGGMGGTGGSSGGY